MTGVLQVGEPGFVTKEVTAGFHPGSEAVEGYVIQAESRVEERHEHAFSGESQVMEFRHVHLVQLDE